MLADGEIMSEQKWDGFKEIFDWTRRREIALVALWKAAEALDADMGNTMSISSHYEIFRTALNELNSIGPDPLLVALGKPL